MYIAWFWRRSQILGTNIAYSGPVQIYKKCINIWPGKKKLKNCFYWKATVVWYILPVWDRQQHYQQVCSSQQVNKSRNKFKFYFLLSSKNSVLLKQLSWRQTIVALLRWNMQCKSEKTSSFSLSSDRLSFNTELLIKEERRRLYDFSLTCYFSTQLLFLFKLV